MKGIETYEVTTRSIDQLSNTAEVVIGIRGDDVERQALTMTRDSATFFGTDICYGHVMAWLLKSGLVSLRWYAQHWRDGNAATLGAAFGRPHPPAPLPGMGEGRDAR